jgi:peptide-methionine (S)-S-oxide reductase
MGLIHLFLYFILTSSSYAAPVEKAVFAGGCFWCMEHPYDIYLKKGVINVKSGYSGGQKEAANYSQVSAGNSGHREVIEVEYDPAQISYQKLVDIFWENIDPFDGLGQFCDKGEQYTSAIYYNDDEEKKIAENSLNQIGKKFSGKKIKTLILKSSDFYPAEDYHQDYYLKNPIRYKYYRYSCGRDQRLKEIWKK